MYSPRHAMRYIELALEQSIAGWSRGTQAFHNGRDEYLSNTEKRPESGHYSTARQG